MKVLFVCLGNICRSPMAEAIFAHQATAAGLADEITWDSAGTSNYHPGDPPDERTLKVLAKHGIETQQQARQIKDEDFNTFNYILAMDHKNLESLLDQREKLGHTRADIMLMDSFSPHKDVNDMAEDVPDPYWSQEDGFEEVFQILEPACATLLEEVKERLNASKERA